MLHHPFLFLFANSTASSIQTVFNTQGLFADFVGGVETIVQDRRVRVLMNFIGVRRG